MKHYLDKDCKKYGMSTEYDIQEGEQDEWLGDVDDSVNKGNV
jgi:hypothetical protein